MLVSVLIIVSLALWFILSALNQLPGRNWKFFKKWDCFALLPSWSFFAPRPGMTDYHLLYRDRWDGGEFDMWREVSLYSKKQLASVLWNPDKRKNKALVDMIHDLLRVAKKVEHEQLCLTVPYIVIATYIGSLKHSAVADASQFMIMESFGFHSQAKPEVVFVSAIQGLP